MIYSLNFNKTLQNLIPFIYFVESRVQYVYAYQYNSDKLVVSID